ncbi:15-cis-phytoene desaturase, chloroplastic/chromoplastic [Tanacetum coccineum]|uniref:15-cis-phytoene desaturase, chloroplastic/chromoplastic n=1 Tax=Tanacetum coccineum TaxID=301880 RepID=A0ABQ5G6G1_9ASTR
MSETNKCANSSLELQAHPTKNCTSASSVISTAKSNDESLNDKFITASASLQLGYLLESPFHVTLNIDDFDLQLTPVVRSYSSTHVEPSPLNPVTIIPGPAGIVQLSSSTGVEPSSSTSNPVRIIPGPAGLVQRAKLLKENVFILNPDGALMSTQDYMQKVVEDVGEDADFKRAVMILANVSVFIPKPSKHYLNITKRNVVDVFRKDTVLGSGSG